MSSPRGTTHLTSQSRKRKHSEISGLVNDEAFKKRRHDPEEETNLWTTVKNYLNNPAGHSVPSVSCPICAIPIAIRGVPILEPCPWKLADGSQKVGAVLPCAHILCQECINRHIAAQNELSSTGQKSCPCCRADLLFPGCLHTIPSQRLPVATSEGAFMVPLTIPELRPNEHRFPEDCWDCTAQTCEEYIDTGLRFVSEMLHGVGYLPGEGPREWDDVIEASQVVVWNYLEHQRAIPSWRNGSVPVGLLGVSFAGEASVPVELLRGFEDPDCDAIVYNPAGGALWYVPVPR